MPLFYDGTVLRLHAAQTVDQIDELTDMPDTVRVVTITTNTEGIYLPRLPAHVEVLELYDVRLLGLVTLGEGLRLLRMSDVTGEVSMAQWSFPASLEELHVSSWLAEPLDLRASTADQIFLPGLKASSEVLFPDVVEELTLAGRGDYVLAELPRYLRNLTLGPFGGGLDYGRGEHRSVKRLCLNREDELPAFRALFPELKELYLSEFRNKTLVELDAPTIQALTVEGYEGSASLRVIAPELETLSLIGDASFDRLGTLGETVTTLNLKMVDAFPEADNWDRLHSITIENSRVELPYIRWLDELEIDWLVRTNGVQVSSLEDYQAAWDVRPPAKSARSARR